MTCDVASRGTIELYFYGELPPAERALVQAHLDGCDECRHVLGDLRAIRAALAARPDVASPPRGDWSRFMAGLDAAVEQSRRAPAIVTPRSWTRQVVPYLAMAALLALVTIGVVAVVRGRALPAPAPAAPAQPRAAAPSAPRPAEAAPDPALVALSGRHFERSKLVLLGLTTMDASGRGREDWKYERELANTLLGDTRLYRQAAEERGMQALAGVMRDLELVLLQTSMSQSPDAESLGQLQRLIRRRDLLTKMDVAFEGGS